MSPNHTIATRFWTFDQNNSGGSFVEDEKLSHRVIVEAQNADEACDRAEAIGVYFNGVEDGNDCECCGDRWYRPYGKGDDEPLVYSVPAAEHIDMWSDSPVRIHYYDGRVVACGRRGTYAESDAVNRKYWDKLKEKQP